MIRSPAPKSDTGAKQYETTVSTPGFDMYQPQDSNTGQSNVNPSVAGITQSTPEDELHGNDKLVITENSADVTGNNTPAQQPSVSSSSATVDVVIPESADETKHETECEQEQGGSKPLLPGIGVFLSKTCTIPLIRNQKNSGITKHTTNHCATKP